MEAQLHRADQDTGLHSGEGQVHDEGEHHHKQSVLKKVKAKAKKIKDHLKHGLGHEHGHEHEQEHHRLQGGEEEEEEEEEEETDDEEMKEGAEVHGGTYVIRSKDIRKEDVVPMTNLENPTSPKEDRCDSKLKNEEVHMPVLQREDQFARPPSLEGTQFPGERHRPPLGEPHEPKGGSDYVTTIGKHEQRGLQGHENTGAPTGLEGHHAAHIPVAAAETHETKGFDHGTALGEQGHQGLQGHENIGAPTGLEGHHAAHRPVAAAETHETKGFDHGTALGEQGHQGLQGHENIGAQTGLEGHHAAHRPVTAAETHETKGFDHVTASGEQGHENIIGAPAGLANQQAFHFSEQMDRPPAATDHTREPKGIDYVAAGGELEDQGMQEHKFKVLTSLEEDPHVPKHRPEMNPDPTNYQSKVTDPTGANNEEAGVSPLVQSFEKMGVNNVPVTRRKQGTEGIRTEPRAGDMELDQGTEHSQYTGSHDQFAPQEAPTNFASIPEDTESIPKSMNTSNPQDLPHDKLTGKPGSYTEKISSATSVIADKAVAAKNVVTSKLGYGGTKEETSKTQVTEGDKDSTKTTSATGLAQKAASTVAGKLAPVYEKVAGAGSTVMAKVQGTATGVAGHEGCSKETNKGVSMKEYLAEKLKPGEEDKALSEVISGSLSRHKEKIGETGEAKPMGKVTESEEVERRLGPIGNTMKEEDVASGETQVGEGFGQGVVDRVKGAVSTWFGKGGETQTSSGISNDSAVDGGAVVGGRG